MTSLKPTPCATSGGTASRICWRRSTFTSLVTVHFPPLKTLYLAQLPIPSTPFLGRERELSEVVELLARDEVRLADAEWCGWDRQDAPCAPVRGGALAEQYPDGIWWVALASLRDPQLVLVDRPNRRWSSKGDLTEHIRDKKLLLLLDNCEHLVEAAPALADLLCAFPNLKLLVTSREPLHLSAEWEYVVPSLTKEEALELFEASGRVSQLQPEEIVRSICLRLDCLPLAIELAAARTKALSPGRLLERLERPTAAAHRWHPATRRSRQKTLRATIAWSLRPALGERATPFRPAGAFSGGCTLEAAEAVCDADLDTLQSLLDKSLIRHTEERFWMLETIREYAEERLEQAPDAEDLRGRHARFFNRFAAAGGAALVGPKSGEIVDVLEAEHPNIRLALGWAIASGAQEDALATTAGIWRFWELRGHVLEGLRCFDEARDATGSPDAVRLEAFRGAAALARDSGQVARAEALAKEMLALAQSVDDVRMKGIAAAILGSIAGSTGDFEAGMSHLEEARTMLLQAGDELALSRVINTQGYIALRVGDYPSAARYGRESLAAAARIGDATGRSTALVNLGYGHLLGGRDADAEALLVECLRYSHEIGFTDAVGYAFEGLAALAVRGENGARAARLLGAAELLRETAGTQLDFVESEVHDDIVKQLSDLLSHVVLAAEWNAGREMAADEAIDYALSVA